MEGSINSFGKFIQIFLHYVRLLFADFKLFLLQTLVNLVHVVLQNCEHLANVDSMADELNFILGLNGANLNLLGNLCHARNVLQYPKEFHNCRKPASFVVDDLCLHLRFVLVDLFDDFLNLLAVLLDL